MVTQTNYKADLLVDVVSQAHRHAMPADEKVILSLRWASVCDKSDRPIKVGRLILGAPEFDEYDQSRADTLVKRLLYP